VAYRKRRCTSSNVVRLFNDRDTDSHSHSERNSSTEDSESCGELNETDTATLACDLAYLHMFQRLSQEREPLTMTTDNLLGFICMGTVFTG